MAKKITEEDIKLIIKEETLKTIDEFFKSECVNHHNIDNKKAEQDRLIREGLIRTYPSSAVTRMLERLFNNQYLITTNWANSSFVISIQIPNSLANSDSIGQVIQFMNTCGYFKYTKNYQNEKYVQLQFEPKFSGDITNIIKKVYGKTYHMTTISALKKKKKIGLVPYAKNKEFNYPPRIFAMVPMNNGHLNDIQTGILTSVAQNKTTDEDGNIISHQDFHILGINLEKMPSNVKFYYDPNAYGSVFTYDNIPPSALEYNPEY